MLLVLILSFLCLAESMGEEPRCSRFEFEKNLLEMLVRLEFKLDAEIKIREENDHKVMQNMNSPKGDVTLQNLEAVGQELFANVTENVRKELKDIWGIIRNMEKGISDAAHFQAYSNKTLQQLKETDQQLNATDREILANMTVPPVYFLVKVAKSRLNSGRPIFSSIIHNEGGSYDVSTGLFTCRVAGLYNFVFNFVTEIVSDYCTCHIQRNINDVHFVYGQGDMDSSSLSTYLYLELGDTVDIQCSGWEVVAHSSSGTYFSGALIRI